MRPVADVAASRRAGDDAAEAVGDGFQSETRGKKLGGSLAGGLVMGIGVGLAQNLPGMIGSFAGELFGLAGSMEEIDRRAGVVFGDNLPRATAAIDDMNESLGLSESQALGAASGIQDILVPMGFARDEATGMSLDLLELGGALAGNTGGLRTAEEAHQALIAALTGEREQLKAYGVVLNEETVKQRVAEMATQGVTFATEQQAKAAATLQLVTEASADAISLWNDRAGTQAAATAEAKAKMQEAKEELAQGLAPAMLAGTELAASFAGTLATGTKFLVEHKDAVLILGAAYAAYQGATMLQGVISKVQLAATAHDGLTNAMKSGLTKAFNPTALATAGLAIGVGLLIKSWQDAKAARREFNKDAATVAGALTTEHGLVVSLAGSWDDLSEEQQGAADSLAQYLEQDSRFKDRNQGDDLTRMGLTWEDLGEAIHGGSDAFRDFLERGEAAGEFAFDNAAAMDQLVEAHRAGPEVLSDTIGAMETWGTGVRGNTDLLQSFVREMDLTVEGLRDTALGAIVAAEAAGGYGSAQADALKETVAASESISELMDIQNAAVGVSNDAASEVERLTNRYRLNADMVDANTDAVDADAEALAAEEEAAKDTRSELEKLGTEYGDLADLVDEARAAIDRMNGGQVNLDDATLALRDQTDALSSALEENGNTFDIGTEKGRENMEQARDTAGSIRDLELAMIENGSSAEEAAASGDFLRESLRQQLDQAGLTKDEIDELITTYAEVPDEVATAMEADTRLATFAVANYTGALNGIPRNVNTTVTTTQRTILEGSRSIPRAHGGRIGGGQNVLVGERGPEVIQLDGARGGNVIPTHGLGGLGGAGIQVNELHVNVEGTMDMTNPAAARTLAERIQQELVRLEAENR